MAKRKDGETEEAAESGEARVYELGFHLDPELPADVARQAYSEIRARVAKAGAIVAEGEPEKVTLAYTVSRQEVSGRRDFDSAYFCWIAYEAPVEAHEEVVKAAGADTRIIRFIDLTTDKEAARHAAERAALAEKSAGEPAEAEPESADAALDAALANAI